MKKIKIGQKVVVYDSYRLGVPTNGEVIGISSTEDIVCVKLFIQKNGYKYIWVSRRQLRKNKKKKLM